MRILATLFLALFMCIPSLSAMSQEIVTDSDGNVVFEKRFVQVPAMVIAFNMTAKRIEISVISSDTIVLGGGAVVLEPLVAKQNAFIKSFSNADLVALMERLDSQSGNKLATSVDIQAFKAINSYYSNKSNPYVPVVHGLRAKKFQKKVYSSTRFKIMVDTANNVLRVWPKKNVNPDPVIFERDETFFQMTYDSFVTSDRMTRCSRGAFYGYFGSMDVFATL